MQLLKRVREEVRKSTFLLLSGALSFHKAPKTKFVSSNLSALYDKQALVQYRDLPSANYLNGKKVLISLPPDEIYKMICGVKKRNSKGISR